MVLSWRGRGAGWPSSRVRESRPAAAWAWATAATWAAAAEEAVVAAWAAAKSRSGRGRKDVSVREAWRGFGSESALRKSELDTTGCERRRSAGSCERSGETSKEGENDGMKAAAPPAAAAAVGDGAAEPAMLRSVPVKAGSISPDGFG